MTNIQLEFNIEDKNPEEIKLSIMQIQIDKLQESMGKVRRKMFSELSEMKSLYLQIQKENENLKNMLKEIKNEKTEWVYRQNDCLFDVREYKKA